LEGKPAEGDRFFGELLGLAGEVACHLARRPGDLAHLGWEPARHFARQWLQLPKPALQGRIQLTLQFLAVNLGTLETEDAKADSDISRLFQLPCQPCQIGLGHG
jgi:hypothetical protein